MFHAYAPCLSHIVFADWCGPCQQIAPVYEALSQSLTRPDLLTFVKVDTEKNQALSEEYQISALPTFLLFQKGKVIQTVQGANPTELRRIIQKLSSELESADEASGSAAGGGGGGNSSSSSNNGPWTGAEIPRGYSDISDQVETRNSELLNADDDAGPVKVLFDVAKPAALNNDDNTTKDYVQSGADDQLLLFIPFQGTVKLHTLQVGDNTLHYSARLHPVILGAKTNVITRLPLFHPRDKTTSQDPRLFTCISTDPRTWTLAKQTIRSPPRLSP